MLLAKEGGRGLLVDGSVWTDGPTVVGGPCTASILAAVGVAAVSQAGTRESIARRELRKD